MEKHSAIIANFATSRLTRTIIVPFVLLLFIVSLLLTVHDIPYISSSFTLPNSSATLSSLQPDSPIFQSPDLIHQYDGDYTPNHIDPLDRNLAIIRDFGKWRLLGAINETGERMYHNRRTGHFFKDEANIAFFLQIAESSILLAPRLLSRLWHPKNVYAIHFDTKIPKDMTRRFVQTLRSNPLLTNVIIVPSVPVTYKGISELLNTLDSIHTLLKVSKTWDYYINLSGSDYPLISPVAIRRLLATPGLRESSRSFIEFAVLQAWDSGALQRLGRVHFDPALSFRPDVRDDIVNPHIEHQGITFPRDGEKGNLAIRIARGPAWIIAHRSFSEYAVHSNPARRVSTLFSTMKCSPEHYFQTIAWNHHMFNESIIFRSMRDVAFSYKGVPAGQHPYYRDEKNEDGKWEMWPDLAFSPEFFARKFKVPNSKLLDHIDTQKSGAAVEFANMTAVEQSFALVQERFLCLLNYDRNSLELDNMKPCKMKTRIQKGCDGKANEVCLGDFAEPPS